MKAIVRRRIIPILIIIFSAVIGIMNWRDYHIIGGYSSYNEWEWGWRYFQVLEVYEYSSEYDSKYAGNRLYSQVSEDNFENVKRCVYSFVKHFDTEEARLESLPFNTDLVTLGDYYSLREDGDLKFELWYYHNETHILYYLKESLE